VSTTTERSCEIDRTTLPPKLVEAIDLVFTKLGLMPTNVLNPATAWEKDAIKVHFGGLLHISYKGEKDEVWLGVPSVTAGSLDLDRKVSEESLDKYALLFCGVQPPPELPDGHRFYQLEWAICSALHRKWNDARATVNTWHRTNEHIEERDHFRDEYLLFIDSHERLSTAAGHTKRLSADLSWDDASEYETGRGGTVEKWQIGLRLDPIGDGGTLSLHLDTDTEDSEYSNHEDLQTKEGALDLLDERIAALEHDLREARYMREQANSANVTYTHDGLPERDEDEDEDEEDQDDDDA